MNCIKCPSGADFEYRAIKEICAASLCRAIEIAIAALHQSTGAPAIIAAGERIQNSQCTIGADFEYSASGDRPAASGGRAIEIAVIALHQPGLGSCAII